MDLEGLSASAQADPVSRGDHLRAQGVGDGHTQAGIRPIDGFDVHHLDAAGRLAGMGGDEIERGLPGFFLADRLTRRRDLADVAATGVGVQGVQAAGCLTSRGSAPCSPSCGAGIGSSVGVGTFSLSSGKPAVGTGSSRTGSLTAFSPLSRVENEHAVRSHRQQSIDGHINGQKSTAISSPDTRHGCALPSSNRRCMYILIW